MVVEAALCVKCRRGMCCIGCRCNADLSVSVIDAHIYPLTTACSSESCQLLGKLNRTELPIQSIFCMTREGLASFESS